MPKTLEQKLQFFQLIVETSYFDVIEIASVVIEIEQLR